MRRIAGGSMTRFVREPGFGLTSIHTRLRKNYFVGIDFAWRSGFGLAQRFTAAAFRRCVGEPFTTPTL
jgi:hypothetical protein